MRRHDVKTESPGGHGSWVFASKIETALTETLASGSASRALLIIQEHARPPLCDRVTVAYLKRGVCCKPSTGRPKGATILQPEKAGEYLPCRRKHPCARI